MNPTAATPVTSTIVVGVDGSAESLAALRWALTQAGAQGAVVDVVHCWQPHSLTDLAYATPHELSRASVCMLDNEVAAAQRDLGTDVEVRKVSVHGRPAAVLVQRANGASMVVLGLHNHTNLRERLLGTVAAGCVKHAGCPVVEVSVENVALRHPRGGLVTTVSS